MWSWLIMTVGFFVTFGHNILFNQSSAGWSPSTSKYDRRWVMGSLQYSNGIVIKIIHEIRQSLTSAVVLIMSCARRWIPTMPCFHSFMGPMHFRPFCDDPRSAPGISRYLDSLLFWIILLPRNFFHFVNDADVPCLYDSILTAKWFTPYP